MGKARYIENTLNEAFKICRASFNCVDSVLLFERKLNSTFPPDKKYEKVKHGNKKAMDYSTAYAKAYQTALKGMVARRMRCAILEVGSFWFSAWLDAGQPDLNKLINQPLSADEKKNIQREVALCRIGKISN